MRFQVPQFIEVEDKLGAFTIKQYIYLIGGGGICFIIYTVIGNLFLSFVFMSPVIALSLALAFYRINNRPFISVVESAFFYFTKDRLYIWKKEQKPIISEKANNVTEADMISSLYVPKLSDSKLKDLTWSLDIKQSLTPAQGKDGKRNF